MDVPFFIARRLRYKGRIVTAAVAISFMVVIIAVAVSSGFRHEVRKGISSAAGDVLLMTPEANFLDESSPISASQSYIPYIKEVNGVMSVDPLVCRAGIVRHSEDIYGVLISGVEGGVETGSGAGVRDSMAVSIPSSMAEKAGLKKGDRLLTYFIGEKVKVRQFNIADVYEPMIRLDDRYIVYADISTMRRLNEWSADQVSMFQITLSDDFSDRESIEDVTSDISDVIYENVQDDDDMLVASSTVSRYPQIFDWLGVIDFNVVFVLLLMIAVAGVNMITGLLIMLFENTSTIGVLKSLGMRNSAIAGVFLFRAAGTVMKGMVIGNALALLFCLVQDATHFISLDPVNYFISFVPVHLDIAGILITDAVAFAAIMVLLLIPSLFVLRVDPAKTVKMD